MREGERPALQHPPGMLENELSETWMVSGLSGQDNSRRVNASHAGSVPVLTKREFYNKGGFVAFRCYNISTGCWDSCGWPLPASLQPPHSGSKCTFRPLSHRHSHFFSLSLHLWLAYLAPSHRQAAMEAHATALFSNKVGTNTCSHALLSSSFHFLQQPVIYRANIQEHHARCLQHKGHTVRVPEKVECRVSGHTDTHVVSYPGLQCHPAHSGQTINFSHKFSVLGSQLLRLFRGMCWAMLGIEAYTMCYWDVQWFTRSEARLGALGRDLLSRILLSQCFTGRSLFIFDDLWWWMLLR